MGIKERLNLFERDSTILEEIAGKYSEDSNEHCAFKHAAIALWYALADDFERFKEFVVKFQGDLSPEQRSHLLAMGIDPDVDPDSGDESNATTGKPMSGNSGLSGAGS